MTLYDKIGGKRGSRDRSGGDYHGGMLSSGHGQQSNTWNITWQRKVYWLIGMQSELKSSRVLSEFVSLTRRRKQGHEIYNVQSSLGKTPPLWVCKVHTRRGEGGTQLSLWLELWNRATITVSAYYRGYKDGFFKKKKWGWYTFMTDRGTWIFGPDSLAGTRQSC